MGGADGATLSAAEQLYHRGVRHHLDNRLEEAIDVYKEALRHVPDHLSVTNNLGGALISVADQKGRADSQLAARLRSEAGRLLERATSLSPGFYDAYLNLGVLRRKQGELAAAAAAYGVAASVASADDRATAHERLGIALLELSRTVDGREAQIRHTAAAAAALGTAAMARPGDRIGWERHGDALLALATHLSELPEGRLGPDAAAALSTPAPSLPPPPDSAAHGDLDAGSALSPALSSQHTSAEAAYEQAVETLARAVELEPTASSANSKLAIAAHGLGVRGRPRAILSGVYYARGVEPSRRRQGERQEGGGPGRACAGWGERSGNGSLELIDPRYSLRTHRPPAQFEPSCQHLADGSAQLRAGYFFEHSAPVQLAAAAGVFVLFPAWLMHRVKPHAARGTRASVSFNVWVADEDGGLEHTRRLFDGAFKVK